MTDTVAVVAIGAILGLGALLSLVRLVRGPSVLDRAVALEVLVGILIGAFGLDAATNRDTTTLPTIISLSLLAFTGSVAMALFTARDRDDREPGRLSGPGHPGVGPAGTEVERRPGTGGVGGTEGSREPS